MCERELQGLHVVMTFVYGGEDLCTYYGLATGSSFCGVCSFSSVLAV